MTRDTMKRGYKFGFRGHYKNLIKFGSGNSSEIKFKMDIRAIFIYARS